MDRRDFIRTLGVAGGAMLLNGTVGTAVRAGEPRKNCGTDPLLSGV